MRLFHLIDPAAWSAAHASGTYRPDSLDTDGFVHFSFATQVTGTANLRYRAAPQLVVLEVDSARLSDLEVVVEDSYGTGTQFPHVYGPIPTGAVVAVHPIGRTDSGDWSFTAP